MNASPNNLGKCRIIKLLNFLNCQHFSRGDSPMKAVIIAAGKGIRLLPLTEEKPKTMVEINGRPFLYYIIKHLQQAGFHQLSIVVGYKKEKMVEFLQQQAIPATIIEQQEQLGTGHALLQARKFCGNSNFLMLGGDNLFSGRDMKALPMNDALSYVTGAVVEEWRKYGILVTKDSSLIKIVEKSETFVGNLANAGLYKFTPEIWPALEKIQKSPRGEYEVTDAINMLAKKRKVKVLQLNDYWLDLGEKEDVVNIEGFLKDY